MERFDVPVALFLFKRIDKPLEIIRQLAKIAPARLYLLSDGGRNDEERRQVAECREAIERAISWECEVVKKYEAQNVGVYENIAGGAKWVLQREPFAIFLEDDNFPEVTFFQFCKELLIKYERDTRVLWICGTNYLKAYEPQDGSSYVFTKNMMPCGWASWASKFIPFYDGELTLWQDPYVRDRIRQEYAFEKLYYQDRYNVEYELDAKAKTGRFYSWDYQMSFSIRAHNLYGIVPAYNQITNIGVDSLSTHGGTSMEDVMTERFCGLPTRPMDFPLKHPKTLLIDEPFEVAVAKIILHPKFYSIKSRVSRALRKLLGIRKTDSILGYFKSKIA